MTKTYLLSLGGNVGNVLDTFESAGQKLKEFAKVTVASSPCQSPALMPEDAPSEWDSIYWNSTVEIITDIDPCELLRRIKLLEQEFGRDNRQRWSPRPLDIDIIDVKFSSNVGGKFKSDSELKIPHPSARQRPFVLGPTAWIRPNWRFSDEADKHVIDYERMHRFRQPALMGIINITPDSFSDGGKHFQQSTAIASAESMRLSAAQYVDLGAESTGPDAKSISPEEEWNRLFPVVEELCKKWKGYLFRPRVSIDTRNFSTAEKVIELGVDTINDVSGLADPRMLQLAAHTEAEFIAMHSLTIPTSRKTVIADNKNPIPEMSDWMKQLIARWDDQGLARDRLILDPGIGFGKKSNQSWQLMAKIRELPWENHRLLVGHSRKSFLSTITQKDFQDRDIETVGVSLTLADFGVDILRVHDVGVHIRAFHAKLALGNYA